jgi:TRIAD3 protein (E3 ubiquitin-protein ligase RNF216)
MTAPLSDGHWQCSVCYCSVWHSTGKICCAGGCPFCTECAKLEFERRIFNRLPTVAVTKCIDPDCSDHFDVPEMRRLLSDRAAERLRGNDASSLNWDRPLEVGESYFQCPECERVWIASGDRSPCPSCATAVCRWCWGEWADGHICTRGVPEEEAMSEAVIRNCPRCRIRFVKDDGGCNHVVCPRCRAHICYHCGRMFTGENIYRDHLGLSCPLSSEADTLNESRIETILIKQ